MSRTSPLIICLVALSWAKCAGADTFDTLATAGGCVGPTPSNFCVENVRGLSGSLSATLGAGTGTVTMFASNQSGFGILHSSAAESFSGSSSPVVAYVDGLAGFTDTITISNPRFTGSQGYLIIGFNLDGINSQSGSLLAWSYVNVLFEGPSEQQYNLNFTSSSVSGVFSFPQKFIFIYGQPFELDFSLVTVAGTLAPSPTLRADRYATTAVGTANSDFSDTFVLSALDVVDSQGDAVNGATFTSASGTHYSTSGVVPEPSSVALLVTGVIFCGLVWRNFRLPTKVIARAGIF